MKRTIVACLLLSGALLGFTGCSSDKTSSTTAQPAPAQQPAQQAQQPPPPPPPPKKQKDKRPIDQRLTVGMTMDEVVAACGKPKGKGMSSDGETWNYNNAQNAFIPYYSLSGGKITFVTIQFDKDGKVKSWDTREESRY